MKLASTLALAVLASLTQATPITSSQPETGLEAREGPYCHTTKANTNCYKGAGLSYTIKSQRSPAANAGGTCKAYGDLGNGHR